MPTLSVVIPVLDDAQHLTLLLAALAAQTRGAEQIIVVDNGCSDPSPTIAREAGATVIHEPRRGIGAAAWTGYTHATGEVIIRCDADTLPDIQWLERISKRFDQEPELDALTGPGYFTDLPWWGRGPGSIFYALSYFGGFTAALAKVPLWGSNMAFRQELWQQVQAGLNIADPRIHDDLDFSCNLPASARVAFDPRLRVRAAGRVFARAGGLADSIARARWTLDANGGKDLIFRRWHSRLGLGRHERA